MSRRKDAAILSRRARRDLSSVFAIPTLARDAPAAPQPAAFRGALYPHQRRSLHRMLEIEAGVRLDVRVNRALSSTLQPAGGVLADSVGMGKTAQIIALLLAKPSCVEPPSGRPVLVVTPAHLVQQWGDECRKFAGPSIDVSLLTAQDGLKNVLAALQRTASVTPVADRRPHVVVATLGFVAQFCRHFNCLFTDKEMDAFFPGGTWQKWTSHLVCTGGIPAIMHRPSGSTSAPTNGTPLPRTFKPYKRRRGIAWCLTSATRPS